MKKFITSIIKNLKIHNNNYLTPLNLSFISSFGSLLGFCMAIQVFSGVFLSFFYNSDVSFAFYSVENIMRNIKYG